MIEQGFNYADSTSKEMSDFFEIRVENLEPKEEKSQEDQEKITGRLRLQYCRVQ